MTEAAAEPKAEGHDDSVIAGAREELRAVVRDLKSIRYRLLGVKASIPPTAQETSREDLDGDPEVEPEMRTVIANGILNCLDPFIDDLGTAAEYRLGWTVTGSPSIAHLDLGVFSEETRRALHEVVAAENFGLTGLPSVDEWARPHTAEQAGLEVTWAWGRWFATWWRLDLPDTLPEAKRRETLLLEENRNRPGTLAYREV